MRKICLLIKACFANFWLENEWSRVDFDQVRKGKQDGAPVYQKAIAVDCAGDLFFPAVT